jgi:hypothetical protein
MDIFKIVRLKQSGLESMRTRDTFDLRDMSLISKSSKSNDNTYRDTCSDKGLDVVRA